MGILFRNPNENAGCVTWVVVGIGLIVAGVVAIMGGFVDALF